MKKLILPVYIILFSLLALILGLNFITISRSQTQALQLEAFGLNDQFDLKLKEFNTLMENEEIRFFKGEKSILTRSFRGILLLENSTAEIYPFNTFLFRVRLPEFRQENIRLPAGLDTVLQSDLTLNDKLLALDTLLDKAPLKSLLRQELLLEKIRLYAHYRQFQEARKIIKSFLPEIWPADYFSYASFLIFSREIALECQDRELSEYYELLIFNLVTIHSARLKPSELNFITNAIRKVPAASSTALLEEFESLKKVKWPAELHPELEPGSFSLKAPFKIVKTTSHHTYFNLTVGSKNLYAVMQNRAGNSQTASLCIIFNEEEMNKIMNDFFSLYPYIQLKHSFNKTDLIRSSLTPLMNPDYLNQAKKRILKSQQLLLLLYIIIFAAFILTLLFLRQSIEREKELIREKSVFLNAVSHELKTPVTGIRLIAETLHYRKISDPEKLEKYATRLVEQSGYLSDLVDRLLNYSRMQRNRYVLKKEPVDLELAVSSLISAFQQMEPDSAGAIDFTPDQIPVKIEADKDLIDLALRNLLENAWKYSLPPRKIEILVTVQLKQIQIGVRDNGIGIPGRFQKKIFDEFYRVPDPEQRARGTGLGLAMVRKIAEYHKGSITVISEPGKGSLFTLTLPISQKPVS